MKKLSRELFAGAAIVAFCAVAMPGVSVAEEVKTETPAIADPAKVEVVKADTWCFVTPAKLPASEVDAFLANPSQLLVDEAAGGLPLSNKVRGLAGSSGLAVAALVDLAKTATDPQKAAIGAGLSRVVQACSGTPDYAANIQKLVAELGDASMITAFMAASSDVQVAAVAGPGAANNSVGGGTTTETTGQRSAANSAVLSGSVTTPNSTNSAFDVGSAGASATEFISGVTR